MYLERILRESKSNDSGLKSKGLYFRTKLRTYFLLVAIRNSREYSEAFKTQ